MIRAQQESRQTRKRAARTGCALAQHGNVEQDRVRRGGGNAMAPATGFAGLRACLTSVPLLGARLEGREHEAIERTTGSGAPSTV